MLDWRTETVLPLRAVPDHILSRMRGRKLSVATVWRWALRKQHPLETFKTPGGRFTTLEAIDRFLRACTSGGATSEASSTDEPTPSAVAAKNALLGVITAGRNNSNTR